MERYFLQVLYDMFQIPMACWDGEASFVQPSSAQPDAPVLGDEKLRGELENICCRNAFPVIYLEDEWIYYGIFRDIGGGFACFGPVSVQKMKKMDLEEYRRRHNLKSLPEIRYMGIGLMTKLLALAFSQSTGEKPDYADIAVRCRKIGLEDWNQEQTLEDYMLEQSETDRGHERGVRFENLLMDTVRNGDVEKVKGLISGETPQIEDIAEFSQNHQREMEYVHIITITLLTRAAVEGGVSPEAAYELGDVYLRQLENCRGDTGALTMLGYRAQVAFTEKVREAKRQRSQYIYVDKCKDYIAKNLRKDIRVSDIAPAIGISRGYLSHRFAEAEGISIQQYILQEKCHHAANLLKFSDYSIALISEYFGFSSPSHFASSFKKIFHMTPKEYRQHYSRG